MGTGTKLTECIDDFADGIYLMGPVRLTAYSVETGTELPVIPDLQGDIGGLPLDFAFSGDYSTIYVKRQSDHHIFGYSLSVTTTINVTFLGEIGGSPDFGYDFQSDGARYGCTPGPISFSIGPIGGGGLTYFATYPWNPGAPGEDPSSVAGKVAYPGFDQWSSIKSYLHPGRMYFLSSLVDEPPPALYPQAILQNTVPPANPSTFLFTVESAVLKAHGYKVPCGASENIPQGRLVRFSARNVISWADSGL